MTIDTLLQSREHHWLCVTCVVPINRKRTDHLLYETIHEEGGKNAISGNWGFHKKQLGLLCRRWAQSANRKTIKGNIWCEVGQPGHRWLTSILFSGLLRSFQTLFNVRVSALSRFLARPTSAQSAADMCKTRKSRQEVNSVSEGRRADWKKESSFWPLRSTADPGWGSADGQESCHQIPRFHPSCGQSRIPRCFAPIKAWKWSWPLCC